MSDKELLPPLDGRPGPARALAPGEAEALARAAVARALAEEAAPAVVPLRPRRAWRRGPLLAAAAVAALSLAAAGAVLVAAAVRRAAPPPPPPPARVEPAPTPAAEPAPAAGPAALAPEATPAPAAPAAEVAPAEPPAAAPARRELPAPPPAERPQRRREGTTRRVASASGVTAGGGAGLLEPRAGERAAAEDLLAQANEARRRKDWRTADGLYRTVLRRFPGSDAEVVALVASATLHLERLGDPAGALADYRRALALRPEGPLCEEARWGAAGALRRLGDAGGEARALEDFLQHHPASALAPSARARLEALPR